MSRRGRVFNKLMRLPADRYSNKPDAWADGWIYALGHFISVLSQDRLKEDYIFVCVRLWKKNAIERIKFEDENLDSITRESGMYGIFHRSKQYWSGILMLVNHILRELKREEENDPEMEMEKSIKEI